MLAMVSLVVLLGGCGFRPMYGERPAATASAPASTPVAAELQSIAVERIPDRQGQILRNELTSLLNPSAAAVQDKRYTLRVNTKERVDTFAVERSGFATAANVELTATYTLVEDATGKAVFGGSSRGFTNYSILENDYSTYVAAGDARNRAVTQVAYDIRNRLALHFAQGGPGAAENTPAAEPATIPASEATSDPSGT